MAAVCGYGNARKSAVVPQSLMCIWVGGPHFFYMATKHSRQNMPPFSYLRTSKPIYVDDRCSHVKGVLPSTSFETIISAL